MPTGIYLRSEKHRKKLSEALNGRKFSEETRRKMSKAHKGKKSSFFGKYHSEETKRKMSENAKLRTGVKNSFYGKHHSDKAKRKMGEAHMGMKFSEETKRKLSEIHKGKKHSEEAKRKMRGRIHSEETKRKIGEANRGEGNGNWQGGLSFEPYSPAWTPELRQSIRQRDNFTCQVCSEYPSFNCHHIDYNKKNCEPDNLTTLCRSCHSKTINNREHWKDYLSLKLVKGG